ncbi:hypothetical protein ACU4HD_33740 [Cupriavidus basilensis]
MNIAIIGLGEVGRCYVTALATLSGTTFEFCDTHLLASRTRPGKLNSN